MWAPRSDGQISPPLEKKKRTVGFAWHPRGPRAVPSSRPNYTHFERGHIEVIGGTEWGRVEFQLLPL